MAHARAGLACLRSEALPKRTGERARSVRAGAEHRPCGDSDRTREPRESAAPRSPSPARGVAGVKVLVVDDDDASRDYFATALTIAGAVVATAATAVDALRVAQEQRPDVVLSDIAMPGRDGYWLVREIQGLADPELRNVPVVATTAYGRVHSRQRVLAAGFAEHLAKPVEPDLLYATIARAAGRSV